MIQQVRGGRRTRVEATRELEISRRTLARYLLRFAAAGPGGLLDRRHRNNQKGGAAVEAASIQAKRDGPHRSARCRRDLLQLPLHAETVRRIVVKHHRERTSLPPLTPIRRFQADAPNDLWQLDIQGKVHFPRLGALLRILALDDHSRSILAGGFFPREFRLPLFPVMHAAFTRWGLPQGLFSDRGPPFWTHSLHGETEYQAWARRVGIELHSARQARAKGKIENTFRFAQRDFVLEHLDGVNLDALNGAGGGVDAVVQLGAPAQGTPWGQPRGLLHPVAPPAEERELLLIHEEPRKVQRTGHIGYYGQYDRVPDRYIGRRVWTVLKGDLLTIECNREILASYAVKTDYLKAFPPDS